MKYCETELTFAFIADSSVKVERAVWHSGHTKYDRKEDEELELNKCPIAPNVKRGLNNEF
jgi:hypothetical protein